MLLAKEVRQFDATQCGNFIIFCPSDFTGNPFWGFLKCKIDHFDTFRGSESVVFLKLREQNYTFSVFDVISSVRSDVRVLIGPHFERFKIIFIKICKLLDKIAKKCGKRLFATAGFDRTNYSKWQSY